MAGPIRTKLQGIEEATLGAAGDVLTTDGAGGVSWAPAGGGGGGGTFGQFTATFTVNTYSVTVSVVDATIGAASKPVLSVAKAPGRDADEFEMAPVFPQLDTVTAGVGFTVLVVCPSGDADGDYLINYTRD